MNYTSIGKKPVITLIKKQTNIDCVYQEYNNLYNRKELNYRSSIYNEYLNNNILYNYEKYNSYNNFDYLYLKSKKVVGIIREEGSNGEKEMFMFLQRWI